MSLAKASSTKEVDAIEEKLIFPLPDKSGTYLYIALTAISVVYYTHEENQL